MKKRIYRAIGCLMLGACVAMHASSCTAACAQSSTPAVAAANADRITRVLLVGCDRAASLADSIMLVSINETRAQASILQIPRDTYAEYTDRSYKKLNGAVPVLGISRFESFLENTLGVPIDFYVVLKTDALVGIVDAIGGVDVEIPQDMDYSDPAQGLEIHLPRGMRRLSGAEAEQLVRYRSGYANADLGRLDAQKLFLRAFAKRCQSLSLLEMLSVAMHALTAVQTNLGVQDVVRLARTLRACNVDAVSMQTLSGAAVRGNSGAWYYVVNREGALRDVNQVLFPKTPITDDGFDPSRCFDRKSNERFHAIYTARAEDVFEIAQRFE